jgi:hypothetical protein
VLAQPVTRIALSPDPGYEGAKSLPIRRMHMRAELAALAEDIKQSLELLRRRL